MRYWWHKLIDEDKIKAYFFTLKKYFFLYRVIWHIKRFYKSFGNNLVFNQQNFLNGWPLTPFLHYFRSHAFNKSTVAFHTQSNFRKNLFWWKLNLTESQKNLPLRFGRVRSNLLSFPCNFVILQRIRHWNRFTIENNKLFIEINIDIEIIDFMIPFFIHFVLKRELNTATIHLHCIDKKQRDFVLIESFSFHHVIYQRLWFVTLSCLESIRCLRLLSTF